MRYTDHFLALLLAGVGVAQEITNLKYWVDQTCYSRMNNAGFDTAMKDTRFTAKRALARLDSPGPYSEDIYQFMFGKPKSDKATFDRVKYVFEVIADRMEKIDDQLTANIRFYCDDDEFGPGKRWTITPDQPGDPEDVRNSKLPRRLKDGDPPYQMWQDEKNWVRMSRGSTGCKDEGTKGETQHVYWQPDEAPKDIAIPRCTITLCDSHILLSDANIDNNPSSYISVHSFINAELGSKPPQVNNFLVYSEFVISLTILHELTHIPYDQFDTTDTTNAGTLSYSLRGIYKVPADKRANNAESYASFGLMSRLADKQYRWAWEGNDDEQRLLSRFKGDIAYDENLERVGGENEVPY